MRTFVSLVALGTLATAVHADGPPLPARSVHPQPRPQTPAVNLTPIVLDELPEACKPVAKQAAAPALAVALGARIGLASCLASDAIKPLQLCDCAESIAAIDEAVAPAVALLDEVAAAGDAHNALLAEHARAELYTGMRVRMVATVPPAGGNADSIALRDTRKQLLELQLEPWSEIIASSAERVLELAKANPSLAKHPTVRSAIDASRQRAASRVAKT